jgi:hypothetical protein
LFLIDALFEHLHPLFYVEQALSTASDLVTGLFVTLCHIAYETIHILIVFYNVELYDIALFGYVSAKHYRLLHTPLLSQE